MQKGVDKIEKKGIERCCRSFFSWLYGWIGGWGLSERASRVACLIKMLVQSRDCHMMLCFPIRLYYFSNMNPFSLLALSLNCIYFTYCR